MTSNIEFTYNGKVYQAVPEVVQSSCEGCSFEKWSIACDKAMGFHRCGLNSVIWQEKPADSTESSQQVKTTCNKSEPSVLTWTMEEIRKAHDKYDMRFPSGFIEALLKMKDPEYQKYLELKAKFGAIA